MAAGLGAGRKTPRNMHDYCFRAIPEVPERAANFLRRHLPAGIVAHLADEPPELADGAFLGEVLRNRQTDRLFRVWLKSGNYILVIVAHASKVDPEMAMLLLKSRFRIWDRDKEVSDVKPGTRRPIFALVVYHGKARWTAPRSIYGMISGRLAQHSKVSGDPALLSDLCSVSYLLIDIGRMRED